MNTDWHELIQRHIAGLTTEEEEATLQRLLKEDDAVARLYLRYMNLDVALESHAESRSAVTELLLGPVPVETRSAYSWFSWRPLAAAAAGLVIGLFGASVVFGFALPKAMTQRLALADAGFEEDGKMAPASAVPGEGAWSGDGEVVAAQNGVETFEGKRMLRFVSTKEAANGTEALRVGVAQVVDMRRWRELLREGSAVVNYSASFNGSTETDRVKTTYRIDVRAYTGDVSVLQKPFPERASQEVAHSMWRTDADFDPSKWQRVLGSLILPPETDFLLIELKVFRPARGDAPATAASSHYADDVRLSLVTTSDSKNIALNTPTP